MIGISGKASPHKPLACVMGDMNLVRPIGMAGIRCAVVANPDSVAAYSRFTCKTLCWEHPDYTEALVEALVGFGMTQAERPALFYEEDAQLLLVSRYRERLAQAFHFVVADASLVEDLVDKTRFQVLAERLGLPVPPTRRLRPVEEASPPDLDLRFPLIVKPATRNELWTEIGELGKARRVNSAAELQQLWPHFVRAQQDLLAQELIPGAETRIESYHVYVDRRGEIVADFTGRKIRTYPEAFGHTTALSITDEPDVRDLGRRLTETLGLNGVAKLDFKRGPDNQLHLLEVNPRFNLWHFPGAVAGVNLPALVYADLLGQPRPAVGPVRIGVRWCHVLNDFAAAKAAGMSMPTWLASTMRCEAKSAMSWDDPMPFLRGAWRRCSSRVYD